MTATTVFKDTYPKSKYTARITLLRNSLYEVMAGKVFDEAEFYAKVPKKPEASIIYYEQVIEEYPKSKLVPKAQQRIDEIRALMVHPPVSRAVASTKPPPLTSEEEAHNAEE